MSQRRKAKAVFATICVHRQGLENNEQESKMDPTGQDAAQASTSARASPMMRRQGRMNATNTGDGNSTVSSTVSPQDQQQFYHQAAYPASMDSTHLQQQQPPPQQQQQQQQPFNQGSTSPIGLHQEIPASLYYPPEAFSNQAHSQPHFGSKQNSFTSEDDIPQFSRRTDAAHTSSSQSPLVHPSIHSRTSDGNDCFLVPFVPF